jgi:hypothetical protein
VPPSTLIRKPLSRRYSERTPHAWCREPGCPFTLNGRGPEFDAAVTGHVLGSSHAVEVITSSSAIWALAGGLSR